MNSPEILSEEESSNYLFHYTSEMDHLVSIMNSYFMPFYCMENIEYLKISKIPKYMAFPLVCFCDLPYIQHEKHKAKFGVYGIGMKKKWGIEKHLTPVVYYHSQSITTSSLRLLTSLINEIEMNISEDKFHTYYISNTVLMMMFKPYYGKKYEKLDKIFTKDDKCFYDEGEWRYIPLNVNGLKLYLNISEYHNSETLNEENTKIQKNNRLEFDLKDIGHLFLKSKSEIDQFLSKLSPKYSEEDKKEIISKIRIN